MNWQQFQKNVGMRVQLEPVACRLDDGGNVLPEKNDDWIVMSINATECALNNIRTGHSPLLGKDHIYDFRSNPIRKQDGLKYGFLVLKVQIFLQGANLWLRPNDRPGARVSPHAMSENARFLRARLMDERFKLVIEDYVRRGTPKPMIDTFVDLSCEEKAALYDRAVLWKKQRPSKGNPYRESV